MEKLEDADLIEALKDDVERGFKLLMSRYKEAVYWHIRRLVISHADAQDAAQETFVRVFRSFGRFKSECPLGVWIYRIATHEALRIMDRRDRRTLSLDNPESEAGGLPADEYIDYHDLEAVRLQKAILTLPTKQQLAFNLRYYSELGFEEIAGITGSTAANVKANYHIAKNKVIQYMKSTD